MLGYQNSNMFNRLTDGKQYFYDLTIYVNFIRNTSLKLVDGWKERPPL